MKTTKSLGKRLSGFILAGLGALGVALCLAGIAGLWIVAARLQQVNARLFGQVDQLIVQVDQRATQAGDTVGASRDFVNALKQTVQESAKDLLAERVASLPEIDNVQRRLESAMERSDELLAISASTVELIDQSLTTIGIVVSETSADEQSPSDLMATIRSTRESLADASAILADLQHCLTEIRQKRSVDVNLSEIAKQSLGMVAKLHLVQTRIAALRRRLDETKNRMARLQDKIRTWILAAQWLILLPITWIGAGQFFLFLQGWRLLRPTVAPASDRTR